MATEFQERARRLRNAVELVAAGGVLRPEAHAANEAGAMWRAADLVREHRGDSHMISWAVGGADAVETLLLTEQRWGVPARSYAPSRGWGDADMDAGFDRLTRRGLMGDGEQLTDAGRAFREEVEVRIDELERSRAGRPRRGPGGVAGAPGCLVGGDHRRRLLPQADLGRLQRGRRPHFGSGLTIDTAAEQYAKKA